MIKIIHAPSSSEKVSFNRVLGQWLGEVIGGGASRNNEDWTVTVLLTLSMLAWMSGQLLNATKFY
jgi:hypothetical protein